MGGVFINYRRADTQTEADALYARLGRRFGFENVFKDNDDLRVGEDFEQKIDGALGATDVVLALLGCTWLTPRLWERKDPVRREIERAQELGIDIVPVLLRGGRRPDRSELPSSIQALASLCPITLRPNEEADVDHLLERVAATLGPFPNTPAGLEGFIAYLLNTDADADVGQAWTTELMIPDCEKWFARTFEGSTTRLVESYRRRFRRFEESGGLRAALAELAAAGACHVQAHRVQDPDDPRATGGQQEVLRAMSHRYPLYTAYVSDRPDALGTSLWSFVYEKRGFRLLGKFYDLLEEMEETSDLQSDGGVAPRASQEGTDPSNTPLAPTLLLAYTTLSLREPLVLLVRSLAEHFEGAHLKLLDLPELELSPAEWPLPSGPLALLVALSVQGSSLVASWREVPCEARRRLLSLIEAVQRHSNATVIPMLLDAEPGAITGNDMELRAILRFQALRLRSSSFRQDLSHLLQRLEVVFGRYSDSILGLTRLWQDLLSASSTTSAEKPVLDVDDLSLPDPEEWFEGVFGADLGRRLAVGYRAELDRLRRLSAELARTFSREQAAFEVQAYRFDDPEDPEISLHLSYALSCMTRRCPLYAVDIRPTVGQRTTSLWAFAHTQDRFRFLGRMVLLRPHALLDLEHHSRKILGSLNTFEVRPHEGIALLCLGDTRQQVRHNLRHLSHTETHLLGLPADLWPALGYRMVTVYEGCRQVTVGIGITYSDLTVVTYQGCDLFRTEGTAVLGLFTQRSPCCEIEPGRDYTLPALDLQLRRKRGAQPGEPWGFDELWVGRQGFFSSAGVDSRLRNNIETVMEGL